MRKDMVKMGIEEYREIINEKNSDIRHAWNKADEYMKLYRDEANKVCELAEENGYLKALFDKEGDAQVIKYNGKLYRIVSTSHFHDVGESDTIDINAVCVDEVNRDGKM